MPSASMSRVRSVFLFLSGGAGAYFVLFRVLGKGVLGSSLFSLGRFSDVIGLGILIRDVLMPSSSYSFMMASFPNCLSSNSAVEPWNTLLVRGSRNLCPLPEGPR